MNLRSAVVWIALSALIGGAGCRAPNAEGIPCSSDGKCPPGLTCVTYSENDRRCHSPAAMPGDGGCDGDRCAVDAPVDAPRDAVDGPDVPAGDRPGGCVADAPCAPTNLCHEGRTRCEVGGGSTCEDTGVAQANGTVCGSGMVCSNGTCSPCVTDEPCDRPGQPCKLGRTSCATGAPVCVEAGDKPGGTDCGSGMVCSEGVCTACTDGSSCTPTNPCHEGNLSCTGTTPTCTDIGTLLPNGQVCGTDRVCLDGECRDCRAGQPCEVLGQPCRTGSTSCNTGQSVCVDTGNAPNGQSCGAGKVCSGGSCIDCAAGTACVPANPCHEGIQSCAGGVSSCTETAVLLADGTGCGQDKVCRGGTCVDCAAGRECIPTGTTCQVGLTSCSTGLSVCTRTGNAANGSSCGTNLVCSEGSCISCAASTPCRPTTAVCHEGSMSCTGGVPTCTDLGTNLANGTECGANRVCSNGACVPCTPNQVCNPGGNVCQTGQTACSTGTETCIVTGNTQNGTPCGSGRVCNGGTCETCTAGSSCTPPNAVCHTGTLSCSTGTSTCVDAGGFVANGSPCGTNLVCNGGSCVACVASGSCTPANPCHNGQYSCATGAQTCTDLGTNAANGTACGTNQVCNAGACVACTAGGACTPTNRCHQGQYSCATGTQTCTDLGTNAANGTPCGTNQVCNAGACVACTAGGACTPANPCHQGQYSCATGTQTCTDLGTNAANGTPCGTNQVCNTGVCQSCLAGGACTPPNPCHQGQYSCATGAQVCMDQGTNSPNGTPCGVNQVCNAGVCQSCIAGGQCTPTNRCHVGQYSCETGTQTCADTGTAVSNGTPCGTNQVCNAGACVACTAGGACEPTNRCHVGQYSCATGAQVCTDTGAAVANGTPCGTNQVCNAGSCVACVAGGACTPANPCHNGQYSCATGAAVCVDLGTAATNGTSCGAGMVCNAGQCVACNAGATCTPATACKTGAIACSSGSPVCTVSGNLPNGTSCGPGLVCTNGTCAPPSYCTPGVPILDCPCSTPGVMRCNGAHQPLRLWCSGGVWASNGTCPTNQNCDQTDGTCKAIIAQCKDQPDYHPFCDGLDVQKTCGIDWVTTTSSTCTGTCSAGACVNPFCGDGKVESGEQCDDGNNNPVDGCEPASALAGTTCTRSKVTSLSLGNRHVCALYNGGYVRCWGDNSVGQLGLGHTLFQGDRKPYQLTDGLYAPAGPIDLGGKATAIAAGVDFTCARLSDGSVRCWGDNAVGQLGRGNTSLYASTTPGALGPVDLHASATASAIAVGSNSACALLSNGQVQCWGANAGGKLGLGNATAVSLTTVPRLIGPVTLGATATAVSVGPSTACALLTGGVVRCWGDNSVGQLGLGDTAARSTTMIPTAYDPVPLVTAQTAASISSGSGFNCTRLSGGYGQCWGRNSSGQLGLGNTANIGDNELASVGQVITGTTLPTLITGFAHTCAVFASDNGIRCWGSNSKGELGYADTTNKGGANSAPSTLAAVSFGSSVSATAIFPGNSATCAILSNGQVHCWGYNQAGQLGLGYVSPVPPAVNDYIGGNASQTPNNAVTNVEVLPP